MWRRNIPCKRKQVFLFYSKNLQCLSLRKPQSLTSSDAINEEINRAVKMAGMILGAADSLIPRSEPVSWMAGQAGAVCCLERGGRRPGPGRSGIPGMLSEQTPRRRLWECICPPPTSTSCTCTPRTTPARSFRKAVYLGHGLVRTCFYRLPASQLSLHLIAFAYEPQLMRSPLRPFVWF